MEGRSSGDDGVEECQFTSDTFAAKGGPNAPTIEELAEAVHCEALFSCKERLQDEIEVEFRKHDGYELIFTAPYTPKFNPIEMVWAYTKGDVAYQYKPSRTLSDTAIDIYTRWYGGTGAVDQKLKTGLTPVMAQKFVSHCKAEMNLWIDEYGE